TAPPRVPKASERDLFSASFRQQLSSTFMFASRSLYPASRRPLHNAFSKRNNILKKSYSSSQAAARTTDPGPERRQTHSRHPAQGHDSLLGRTHRHSTTDAVKKSLRDLLRETAQPVAVVTS